MIIDLRTIIQGPRNFELSLQRDWWHSDKKKDQILALDAPLEVKISIYRAGDKYVLEGNLSGGLQVRCDRCLESYHQDLRAPFRVFLALPLREVDKAEVELMEEDLEFDFIRGEKIDLNEVLREQIYLSHPMKSLCRENCMGLCPICGANLNGRKCQCNREQVHPGLLKLKNLKIRNTLAL